MSEYLSIVKKHYKPGIQSLRDDMLARRNPNFFWPTGTQIYSGRQGSGKTISAVRHVIDLKKRYPQAIVVTNLTLNVAFDYVLFQTIDELSKVLVSVNNGRKGVIYLIDEIHTYFNALDSKNIPMFVFTEISQQRKQRKLVIGTSQLFLRLAKPFREQCDNVITCNTLFGVLTIQHAYDGMTLDQDYNGKLSGNLKKRGWFVQTRKLRESFDTFQKVVSGIDQYENVSRVELNLTSKKNEISIKS